MSKRENLEGQVFSHLTVIGHAPERKDLTGRRFWKCRCACGRELVVRADNLKSGHSTQCIQCSYDSRQKRRKGLTAVAYRLSLERE